MKGVVLVALLLVSASAIATEDAAKLFEDFMVTYGRQYASKAEKEHRFACFQSNLKIIEMRNARKEEQHGINQFADLCAAEFNKMYLGLKTNVTATKPVISKVPMTGSAVDWRTKGAVTPVKNQGNCGSCWSFSATGNMEGQWMLAGNTLVGLSEEELVQCSHNGGDAGCNGGLMDNAFVWVVENGGIDSEANYPYTSGGGTTGSCQTAKKTQVVAKFTGHTDMPQSESAMLTWVTTGGPLSIGVDAASGWQTYTGGILKSCPGRQLDHGVLIVGFDTTFTTPYWIVKNSWGASWGESGYIRLEYGHDLCGLTMAASTSIAAKS